MGTINRQQGRKQGGGSDLQTPPSWFEIVSRTHGYGRSYAALNCKRRQNRPFMELSDEEWIEAQKTLFEEIGI